MYDILNHYQINKLLKEILFNSFSFINDNISPINEKLSNIDNAKVKKETELYEKYLKCINSKIDVYLDAR